MIYQWKEGSRISIDAQAAGEEMERIRVVNNGRLDAKDVVIAAAEAASPLHEHFEWNDAAAAERWRLEQAGHLIRCITVEIGEHEGTEPIRAFVSVVRDEDRSFTSIQHAMSDVDLRKQVISQAWTELEAWRKRHAELIEFARVFTAIDQARPA